MENQIKKQSKAEPDQEGFIIKNKMIPNVTTPENEKIKTAPPPMPKRNKSTYKAKGDPDNPGNYKTAKEYEQAMRKRHPHVVHIVSWSKQWELHQNLKNHEQARPSQLEREAQINDTALKKFYASAGPTTSTPIPKKSHGPSFSF